MNVAQAACAPSGQAPDWDQIDWTTLNARCGGCKRVS